MFQKFGIENDRLVENAAQAGVYLLRAPTDEERATVLKMFPIDENNLASALDPDEPPRVEVEPDHRVVIVKYPKNFSGKRQLLFKVASMGLFLFADRLLIVVQEDMDPFNEKPCRVVRSINDVFLRVMLSSIRHYQEHLRVISMISESIEDKISVSMENKHLLNLFSLEKSMVYYLNAIHANGYVFDRLKAGADRIGFNAAEQELMEDIQIENRQSFRQAEIYSNILTSMMDARASIVNNNLNILMKNLNLITICIMVPNLVVGIFSMNVMFPGQHRIWMFWVILFSAIISVAVVLIWWKYGHKDRASRS